METDSGSTSCVAGTEGQTYGDLQLKSPDFVYKGSQGGN